MNTEILQQDVQQLLEHFSKNMYKAKENEQGSLPNEVMEKCTVLMKIDYSVVEISNALGELSSHYPSNLLIPEYENRNFGNLSSSMASTATNVSSQQQSQRQQTIYESTYDASKLRDLINKARFARCRARFPLPIILYRGKYICRSATLSGGPEIYTRSGFDYLFCGENNTNKANSLDGEWQFGTAEDFTCNLDTDKFLDADAYEAQETSLSDEQTVFPEDKGNGEWQLFDRVRSQDIKLLKTLNVETIVDFMVEKKKVKFLMNVTSSEKVDKEKRYADFKIISLPYPGCEFFREFRDNNYSGEGLVFDWSQAHVDAKLNVGVPDGLVSGQLNVDWDTYKGWDLVKITQNYLKLLIKSLQDSSSGLLIHCISGWDRTPLFVSLLRLSLWADGTIHQSLNAIQILYFTIAYDWYLFSHNLPDRLSKGEEIFFFCFYALKYIMDDEYSIAGQSRFRSKHSSGSSSIGVIRADSDVFDGILFEGQDSRGSSISLNSSCSCISTRCPHQENSNSNSINAHFQPMCDENSTNGNNWLPNSQESNLLSNNWSSQPAHQPRTSPVTVPAALFHQRQRNESTSSVSVGSWQMISGTGSLRSQDSNIVVINEQTNHCNNNIQNHHSHQSGVNSLNVNTSESTCTIVDDDCFTANEYFMRRERLTAVRTLFYNCYSSTIGFKFKNGPDSGLGTLLGNFAEKVGLSRPNN